MVVLADRAGWFRARPSNLPHLLVHVNQSTVATHSTRPSSEAIRDLQAIADEIAKAGGTPLAVERDGRLLGVVHLKDIVKGGISERFAELRKMGIRTVMITGDNPLTAAAIAAEAGVDDFMDGRTPRFC